MEFPRTVGCDKQWKSCKLAMMKREEIMPDVSELPFSEQTAILLDEDPDPRRGAAILAFLLEILAEQATRHRLWEVEHLIGVAALVANERAGYPVDMGYDA